MTIRTRVNKNTNKTQYKCRYYYKSYDGARHDSETGWFYSKKEAEDEAKRLKSKKESDDWERHGNNGEKLLGTVFEDFVNYLSDKIKPLQLHHSRVIFIPLRLLKITIFPIKSQEQKSKI